MASVGRDLASATSGVGTAPTVCSRKLGRNRWCPWAAPAVHGAAVPEGAGGGRQHPRLHAPMGRGALTERPTGLLLHCHDVRARVRAARFCALPLTQAGNPGAGHPRQHHSGGVDGPISVRGCMLLASGTSGASSGRLQRGTPCTDGSWQHAAGVGGMQTIALASATGL